MRRGLTTCSTVVAALAAATGVLHGSSWAAESGGLTVRLVPADPADLTARSSFALALTPGATFTGEVVVGNTTKSAMRLAISSVDGLTATTSGAVYAGRRARRRHAARWLTSSIRKLSLTPGATATVSFTIRVPVRATAGDHLAGLAVEDVTPSPHGNGFGVTQVMRSVVGVLVTVPGAARFTPMVSAAQIRRVTGTRSSEVVVRLGNVGRRLGHPRLSVTLAGPRGYRRTVRRRLDTLLPHSAISFPVPWPDRLAVGTYDVTVVLQRLRHRYPQVRYSS
jgi:hypothetical protein